MKRNIERILLFGIVIVALFLRFYQLGSIPNGLYQDETAIGYNAYSILTTGKDEYGRKFPLYFKSFGDYKLPVYVYATVVPIKLLGFTDAAPRIPSAIFGVATVILLFFFTRKLTGKSDLALMSAFMLAINPWHLHYSRATFEVSIGLFFFLAGSMFFLYLDKQKKLFLLSSVICFVIALYTYNLTRLLAPLLFGAFCFLNWSKLKTVSKIEKISAIAIGFVLLVPFFLTIFSSEGAASARGTLITSSGVIQAGILEHRSYFVMMPEVITKIFLNKYILTLFEYARHIASYFSADFLFLKGSMHGNHGIGVMGQLYLFEIITILTGIIVACKQKKEWVKSLFVWGSIVILTVSLTREAPHATRSFFILPVLVIFSSYGILSIFHSFKEKKSIIGRMPYIALFIGALFSVFYYFSAYYYRFPITYAKEWRSTDKELTQLINSQISQVNKVIVDDESGYIYSSYLYYSKFSPQEFMDTVKREADDNEGFSKVSSFGKLEFRKIDWTKDLLLPNVFIVTSAANRPAEATDFQKLQFPQRPVVLSVKEELMMFPVTDESYVLVKTK